MLQNIGDKLKSHRWLGALLLGLLAVIFTLWGAYGIVDLSFGAPNYAVKVNGEEVPLQVVQNAWQQRQSQLQRQLKDEIPAEQRKLMQQQLLDSYIDSTLLSGRARERGMRADTAALLRAYQSEPAFQVEGKFNDQLARSVLAQNNITPAAYDAQQRQQLQSEQLMQSIQATDFLTESELKRIFALENEQRELRYATLPVSRFESAVNIDQAKLQAWYDAHRDDYQSAESARIQYAELSLEAVAAAVKVDQAGLQKWYDTNKARYLEPERRHARHILIAVSDAKDAAKLAAAEKKAREVLAEVRAGKDFGELAKKYSDDSGSRSAGGDLGWLRAGASIDKTFSEALFAMKSGQVSDLVRTQFGFHIIKLDEVQSGVGKTLADARGVIEADYRRDLASEQFGERQEAIQRKLEQDSAIDLNTLAREFGMQAGEIGAYTRAGAPPLGNNADLSALVFNADNIKSGRVAGPVALGDERMVLVRVLQHHPAQPKPLSEVMAEVTQAVRKDQAALAARVAAAEALKKLQSGANYESTIKGLNATSTTATYVGRGDPQLPVQIRDAAFSLPAPAAGKPSYTVVPMESGDAVIVALTAVRPGAVGANSANDQKQAQQYVERERQAEAAAYQLEMRRTANIRRNDSVFSN